MISFEVLMIAITLGVFIEKHSQGFGFWGSLWACLIWPLILGLHIGKIDPR